MVISFEYLQMRIKLAICKIDCIKWAYDHGHVSEVGVGIKYLNRKSPEKCGRFTLIQIQNDHGKVQVLKGL